MRHPIFDLDVGTDILHDMLFFFWGRETRVYVRTERYFFSDSAIFHAHAELQQFVVSPYQALTFALL